MQANFGKKKNYKRDNSEGVLIEGGFKTMLEQREKSLSDIEKTINDVLKDYDGSTIAIITIHEDENGDAEGHRLYIGGVSKLGNQIALGKALASASDDVREKLIDIIKEDPDTLPTVLGAVVDELSKGLDNKKGRK